MRDKPNYAIFHIIGNPEKNLVATMVINSFKEAHPHKDIVVVSAFPDIWLHNPDVYRVYKLGDTPYFYEDYIFGKESEVYAHDPYLTSDYVNSIKPLPQIWCEMLGIMYNNSLPQIYLTQREEEVASKMVQKQRPVLLICGNEVFSNFPHAPFDWTKDLPIDTLQQITNRALEKGYEVLQIKTPNNDTIIGAHILNATLRLTFGIIKNVSKVLTINTFVEHICTSINKHAVVTQLISFPKVSGYSIHTNIQGKKTIHINERLENFSPLFDTQEDYLKTIPSMRGVYSAEEIIEKLEL